MKRILNITSDQYKVSLPNIDSVNISNLNDIINCSVDTIFCYILEYINENTLVDTIHSLLHKLRPSGNLIIRFSDFKKICESYIGSSISGSELLNEARGKHNILSIDFIMSRLLDNVQISKIDYDENIIVMIITRNNI